jgi:hypothetical protein
VDEAIKLMWHNMIGQSKRILLESWFTSCQKMIVIFMIQKSIAVYYFVKILFKDIPINMS